MFVPNVGIGTTAPNYRLHVQNGTGRNFGVRTDVGYTNLGGVVLLSTNDADSAYQPLSIASSVTSFAAGNVGIGTTSPAAKLDVVGMLRVQAPSVIGVYGSDIVNGSYSNYLKGGTSTVVGRIGTDGGAILSGGAGDHFGIRAENDLLLLAGTTERMRVLSGGNVGIGTTNPSAPLHVSTTAVTGNIATFVSTGAGGAGCSIAWNGTSCSSDARLKENVESTNGAEMLENLLQVRPVHFTWIKDSARETQTGFIAQELEQTFPEFVKTEDNGYKQVNYAHFVSVITSALQEFYGRWWTDSKAKDQKIATLEFKTAKIEKIEAENQSLKSENIEIKRELASLREKVTLGNQNAVKLNKNLDAKTSQDVRKLEAENAALKARLDQIERLLKSK